MGDAEPWVCEPHGEADCDICAERALDAAFRSARRKSVKVVGIAITRADAETILGWWDFIQDIGDGPDVEETDLVRRLQRFVSEKAKR